MAGSKKITLKKYTDKSVVVRFDIANLESLVRNKYINMMKSLGGKWNPNLYTGAGWIFPISKTPELRETIKEMNNITEDLIKEQLYKRKKSKTRSKKISTIMKKLKKLHEKETLQNISNKKSNTRKGSKSVNRKKSRKTTRKSTRKQSKTTRKSTRKRSKTTRKSTRKRSKTTRKSTRKRSKTTRKSTRKSTRKRTRKSSKTTRKSASRKKSRKTTRKRSKSAGKTKKWDTLAHNGVVFPEPYKHMKIPMLYGAQRKKKEIMLNSEAEEAAMFYAKVLHLDHVKNSVFRKNFFADWKKLLPKSTEIKNLEDCDFTNFRDYIEAQAEERKEMTKSDKTRAKESKLKSEEKYMTAVVDGEKQNVGNFRVEPPGLFLGRGKHPKTGKIKKRIEPEDIIINIGEKAKIPKPPRGHEWGQVIHDHEATWLASWKENINNDTKYVWLGQDAKFKQNSDEAKFEKARTLRNNLEKIRKTNMENIQTVTGDDKLQQVAIALWFIDNLVLRIGNEKGADEADTVGVCSLRVEHIKIHQGNEVTLDFLGKDSVRFEKTFKVPVEVYRRLKEFVKGKNKKDMLFDQIQPKDVNEYLKQFMPGLSAKVFRTANASILFEEGLSKIKKTAGSDKITVLINKMNKVNADVAIMCNHKKKVSKNHDALIDKLKEQIKTAKAKKKELSAKEKTDAVKKKIKTNNEKIIDLEQRIETRQHMKEVATGTSKINYIDPRITIAFAKRNDIPLEKVFNKQQLKKFDWATEVTSKWKF